MHDPSPGSGREKEANSEGKRKGAFLKSGDISIFQDLGCALGFSAFEKIEFGQSIVSRFL